MESGSHLVRKLQHLRSHIYPANLQTWCTSRPVRTHPIMPSENNVAVPSPSRFHSHKLPGTWWSPSTPSCTLKASPSRELITPVREWTGVRLAPITPLPFTCPSQTSREVRTARVGRHLVATSCTTGHHPLHPFSRAPPSLATQADPRPFSGAPTNLLTTPTHHSPAEADGDPALLNLLPLSRRKSPWRGVRLTPILADYLTS